MAIVDLADVKAHLNIPASDDTHDQELEGYLEAATRVVEFYVGTVDQREITDVYSGEGMSEIVLRNGPAISVTEVVEDGQTLTSSEWALTDGGVLVRVAGSRRRVWRHGVANIVVTYQAGRDPVPANHKLAAEIIIGHLWETQYNLSGGRPQLGDFEEQSAFDPRFGFAVPRRATELLQPEMIPGI